MTTLWTGPTEATAATVARQLATDSTYWNYGDSGYGGYDDNGGYGNSSYGGYGDGGYGYGNGSYSGTITEAMAMETAATATVATVAMEARYWAMAMETAMAGMTAMLRE